MNYQERSQTEILAENLSEIMLRKDLSQNALARKIDVSPTVVNKWCRGISMPRNDKIDRLCQALNITRADLLQDKTTAPNLSVPAAHPEDETIDRSQWPAKDNHAWIKAHIRFHAYCCRRSCIRSIGSARARFCRHNTPRLHPSFHRSIDRIQSHF